MPETILLVDDEEMILDSLSAILEKEGYQVACARDGGEALALLKQKSFDLVITDVRMPGMSGLEMVEQLHGLDQQPKIMVITGYGSIETAVKAQHRGVCDYLIKPINIQRLKKSIRSALQRDEKEQISGTIPLEDKLRDWMEYFSLTSEFTASLNASLDVREILDITLDRIKQIAETEFSSLYLYSRVISDLYYLKNIREMPAMSAGNGISTSLGDAVQLIAEPLLISAGDDKGRRNKIEAEHKLIRQAMDRDEVRHALILPVTIKERVVGLVDICSFREQPFSDVDINILKTIINQASIALAKSLNYLEMEERSKEISLLSNLSLRLNQSLKISDSIKAICEGAVDITGASGSLLQTSLEPGSIKNFIYHKDLGIHKEMRHRYHKP